LVVDGEGNMLFWVLLYTNPTTNALKLSFLTANSPTKWFSEARVIFTFTRKNHTFTHFSRAFTHLIHTSLFEIVPLFQIFTTNTHTNEKIFTVYFNNDFQLLPNG
jgi:hypothetical protein